MNPTCSSLLVHCVDFRIQPAIQRWITDNDLLGDLDIMALPGGCKQKVTILETVDFVIRVHQVNTIYLMQHHDCLAYGGRVSFESDTAEMNRLGDDMERLRRKILAAHGELQVHPLLIRPVQGEWAVVPAENLVAD